MFIFVIDPPPPENVERRSLHIRWGAIMNTGQETIARKLTFSEFSESCRANFIDTKHGTLNHEGNPLRDNAKVQQQLKLHRDALDQ